MKQATFEEKLELGKECIEQLMNPEITLEESIAIYKKGLQIIKEAQEMLEEAKLKVEEINKEMSGVES